MTVDLTKRIQDLRETIPPHVRLIAVTKTVSVEKIREAYAAGVRDFGENKIQEALAKQEELQDLDDICWHFIGHLQSNKVKLALTHFDWIHTCDRAKIAERLDRLSAELKMTPPNVLLQVKPLPDPNKYGWTIPDLLTALPTLDQYQNLKIQGLMTILPFTESPDEMRTGFEKVRDLAQEIAEKKYSHLVMKELSMGMSADYAIAIEAGATMIRLGRTIFGERPA
ncbi:alanine racemase domain protein [Halothece sp. PCC 7418]|uniref:YggS family pyridoxal phosphate-dependent enzyme n=1 Tax=Halothece sp. (strain PCC 7418) TaxID=65093 RepID=UPI0002A068ED|nr:YggS family pyridoxal phosphate-dependent enzyme [Halothece sp. PCC 7418]AFZ43741.1 alanine racemase domain protein [Halothece sp. PCC 7418]